MQSEDIKINTDQEQFDLALIIEYLQQESYWARTRKKADILRSIEESLCWGVYLKGRQIGFGRAVTDYSTVFYLADIFILPKFQNKGIGRLFMQHILQHPDLKDLRGILTTQTAHSFYREFGFTRDNDIVQQRIMVLPNNQP